MKNADISMQYLYFIYQYKRVKEIKFIYHKKYKFNIYYTGEVWGQTMKR